ncbi:MAG: hypothetical protein MZU79_02405 [Anaerotruncus sp.]|nr:hypothetical protein [Anaerotruncus sp.]
MIFSSVVLDNQIVVEELAFHHFGICLRLVGLVDGHDDRNSGSLGMFDRLDGLGLDSLLGRHHQDDDIGYVGAPGSHFTERLMPWSIEERDFSALELHLVGSNVLSDTAGFPLGDMCLPDPVQKRCLSMVDMTHQGNEQVPLDHILFIIGPFERRQNRMVILDFLDNIAEFTGKLFDKGEFKDLVGSRLECLSR